MWEEQPTGIFLAVIFPLTLQWYQPENEDKLLDQLTKILEEDDKNFFPL